MEGAKHPITILTDHQSLQHWMTTKQLTRRQARWTELLANLDSTIQYRPGKQGTRPDALSRRPDYMPGDTDSTTLSNELNPHNYQSLIDATTLLNLIHTQPALDSADYIRDAYNSDPEYLNFLSESPTHKLEHDARGLALFNRRVYIPKATRMDVMHEYHDSPTAGHPGRSKTLRNISRNHWWPNMHKDVFGYVDTCSTCQHTKVDRQKPLGYLMPLEAPEKVWQHVTADFITSLPPSESYNAILVVVDRFTKMAVFIPTTNNCTAAEFAKLFHRYVFCRFGMPESLITDRGGQFDSEYWKSMSAYFGIEHQMSTTHHPQTDGQTERVNQWLEQYLRIYCTTKQDNWSDLLPLAELCYNSSAHTSTGISPMKAYSGTDPRLSPLDYSSIVAPSHDISTGERMQELTIMRWFLQEQLQSAQDSYKRFYDKNHRAEIFKKGERVLLRSTHIRQLRPSKKLLARKLGPFAIKRVINENAYELELPPHMSRYHPVFHISLLSRYRDRKNRSDDHETSDTTESEIESETQKHNDESLVGPADEPLAYDTAPVSIRELTTPRVRARPGWKGWVLESEATANPTQPSYEGPRLQHGRPLRRKHQEEHWTQ